MQWLTTGETVAVTLLQPIPNISAAVLEIQFLAPITTKCYIKGTELPHSGPD